MKLANQQKLDLRQKISDYAKELGFDLVGFSKAKIEDEYLKVFKKWIKNGCEADMSYMRKISARADVSKILPGAKTVIVLGMNYYHEQPSLPRGHGRVARYAYGRDYHKVIGKKLKELEKFINELLSPNMPGSIPGNGANLSGGSARADFCSQKRANKSHCNLKFSASAIPLLTKSYVDTGPILERAFAEQAGLGRIGKNGCLITEKFGSWVFIGEIITTLDLNITTRLSAGTQAQYQKKSAYSGHYSSDSPPQGGQRSDGAASSRWSDPSQKPFNICGNCARCMTACPTGAIIAPGIIDSRLCISYLTIENRKKIPPRLAGIIKKTKRIFGCDICQEVCPHNTARSALKLNRHSTKTSQRDLLDGLLTPIAGHSLNLKKISAITTDKQFLTLFAGSPLMRAKRKGLQRNAKIFT